MVLTLGSVSRKHQLEFNSLEIAINDALKQGHLTQMDYETIQAALARLISPDIPTDLRIYADLDIIRSALNHVKPSYFSRSGATGFAMGALKGAFILCLAVALSPSLPLWLYGAIPSLVAVTDYMFFNHHHVANTIQTKLTAFENGYLRMRLSQTLINQEQFCDEAIQALSQSPFKTQLNLPFHHLRNHLVYLYRSRQLTLSGAIGLHQSMNELMRALNQQNVAEVYRKLDDVERLIETASPPSYQATKQFFVVGAIIGICVIALSVLSVGSFAGFCATVYAVSLLAVQCAALGYLIDVVSTACRQSEMSSKLSFFKSSVSSLFKPMRESKITEIFVKKPLQEEVTLDDLKNAPYLALKPAQ